MNSTQPLQEYTLNQHLIEPELTWAKTGEIAILEIHRPFVLPCTKVRMLMTSKICGPGKGM